MSLTIFKVFWGKLATCRRFVPHSKICGDAPDDRTVQDTTKQDGTGRSRTAGEKRARQDTKWCRVQRAARSRSRPAAMSTNKTKLNVQMSREQLRRACGAGSYDALREEDHLQMTVRLFSSVINERVMFIRTADPSAHQSFPRRY